MTEITISWGDYKKIQEYLRRYRNECYDEGYNQHGDQVFTFQKELNEKYGQVDLFKPWYFEEENHGSVTKVNEC